MRAARRGGDTVFKDVLILMLVGMAFAAAVLALHANPKARAQEAAGSEPPGNVIIEANWPADLDTDVDLWVQAPGDVPVGYSNKGGVIFNLLRDDLGHVLDVSGMNYEVAYSRGIQPGRYIVNAHLYRNVGGVTPVPVRFTVSVKPSAGERSLQILTGEVKLSREGQEVTAFRFDLDARGQLVAGSVDQVYVPLRAATAKGVSP